MRKRGIKSADKTPSKAKSGTRKRAISSYTEVHKRRMQMMSRTNAKITPDKRRGKPTSYSMAKKRQGEAPGSDLGENSYPILLKIDNDDGTQDEIEIDSRRDLKTAVKSYCKKRRLSRKFEEKMGEYCKEKITDSNKKRKRGSYFGFGGSNGGLSASKKSKNGSNRKPKTRPNSKPMAHRRRNSGRTVPKNQEIYERLWFDATEGKKEKELNCELIRSQIYPFQPNYGKPRVNTTEKLRENFFRDLSNKKIRNLKNSKYSHSRGSLSQRSSKHSRIRSYQSLLETQNKRIFDHKKSCFDDTFSTYNNENDDGNAGRYRMGEINSMKKTIQKYRSERDYIYKREKSDIQVKFEKNNLYHVLKHKKNYLGFDFKKGGGVKESGKKGFFKKIRKENLKTLDYLSKEMDEVEPTVGFLDRVKKGVSGEVDTYRILGHDLGAYEQRNSVTKRYGRLIG